MNIFKGTRGIILVALISFLNILSTKSQGLSFFVTGIEYIILYYSIMSGRLYDAFVYLLVFISVTLEMDFYIYGTDAPFNRASFFNPGLLFQFTAFLLVILINNKYQNLVKQTLHNDALKKILRWLFILLVTGVTSGLLGLLVGDNLSSFPILINRLFGYLVVCSIFYLTAVFLSSPELKKDMEETTASILAGVTLSAIVSILLGFVGHYGEDFETMLAPMLVGFSPCLITVTYKAPISKRLIYIILVVIIIIAAFFSPSVIGSKWYLVIAASIITLIYQIAPKMHPLFLIILIIGFLAIIPMIGEYFFDLMSADSFNKWKFNQAINALNIFSYPNIGSWFLELDESARFRIDEPINIAIEYLNKPLYSLFGKGFGGTTLHYTFFCDWDDLSAFSDEQIKAGAYYNMHESFAVLFLQHGILGLVFFFDILLTAIKKMKTSKFAIWGILWFLFYWSFGSSFMLGIVALLLTLSTTSRNTLLYDGVK